MVGVHEIEVRARGDAGEERAVAGPLELVPAHLGDLELGGVGEAGEIEPDHLAGKDAEAGVFAVFVADVEEELEAQADAQEGASGADRVAYGVDEVLRAEVGDGVAEGAEAGEDDLLGTGDFVGLGDDLRGGADAFKCLLNAPQVAHAVVDNRDQLAILRFEFQRLFTACTGETPVQHTLTHTHTHTLTHTRVGRGCHTCE